MTALVKTTRDWALELAEAWDRFWFQPAQPHTLALIRILAGAMLLYTHLVWAWDLESFLGPASWVRPEVARNLTGSPYTWSHLYYLQSPLALWIAHGLALAVFVMLTIGLFTRVVSVAAWLITLAYCHRMAGALFGLDQVNAMLAMYLMIGPSGAVYSVDRWLSARRGNAAPPAATVTTNIAIRLIQFHMCVIYLFGGIGKMRGEMWWDGSALWYAVFNYEYQSLDATWLAASPWLIALLTHITVFWETFYCVLIWPRLTRPIMLTLAIVMHGGICLFLGMITFGLAMIIGNLAFLSPELVRDVVRRAGSWQSRVGQGGAPLLRHARKPR